MTTVLVAEDDSDVRTLIVHVFERAGYRAITADNGTDALELARTEQVDAVVLDGRMPGTSGVRVCRELRAKAPTSGLPILLLTGMASDDDVVAGMDAGADDYLIKPFSPRELVARMQTLLIRPGGRGSLPVSPSVLASVALRAAPGFRSAGPTVECVLDRTGTGH